MNELAFYDEILNELKGKKLSLNEFAKLKRELVRKHKLKKMPTNIQILLHAKPSDLVDLHLLTKPVRSQSGVGVIAIMSYPFACKHGRCIYCPGGPSSIFGDVPQSYTGNEPATMRGRRNDYDSYLQTMNRLEQYAATGHFHEKIELIIMGGTFPSFPLDYQEEFVKYAFKAMNDFSREFYDSKGVFEFNKFKEFFELPGDISDEARGERLKQKLLALKKGGEKGGEEVGEEGGNKSGGECDLLVEQKKNETAQIRCVALALETRPDYCTSKEINEMLKLGCTRVELGVQHLQDEILSKTGRSHDVLGVVNATQNMKDALLKVGYHMMPGLPGSSKEKDIAMFEELFNSEKFMPDALKIYPCMVMQGTKLYDMWKLGEFVPLSTDEAVDIISEAKKFIPKYCRIMRVQRDIPSTVVSAGVDKTNLRQYIKKALIKKGIVCKCIRCREPHGRKIDFENIKIKKITYGGSSGTEIFIYAEDTTNDILLGFCRLRIIKNSFRPEINSGDCGIRELHVYGQAVPLGEIGKVQHRGLGRKLLLEAEKLACEKYNCKKILVISGIGVREYYRKFGYSLDGVYMSKKLE